MRIPATILTLALALLTGPVSAEKPAHAGKPEQGRGAQSERQDAGRRGGDAQAGRPDAGRRGGGDGASLTITLGDDARRTVRDYFAPQLAAGNCPPGLAKKGNGCQPPGQAKKWSLGRPLPRDVVFHDLPRDLAIRLPPTSPGYRYVRVATDILLIAAGTAMVVDAIEDLGRL